MLSFCVCTVAVKNKRQYPPSIWKPCLQIHNVMQVCTTTGPQRVESSAVTKRPKKKLAVPRRIMSLLESNFTIRILTKAVPPRHTCTRSILYIPPPRLTSHKWSLPLRFSALSSKSISSIPRHVLSSQPPWFHHRNNKKRTNYKAPDIWGFRGGQYDVRPSFGAVKTRLHLLQTLVPAQACTPRPRTTSSAVTILSEDQIFSSRFSNTHNLRSSLWDARLSLTPIQNNR